MCSNKRRSIHIIVNIAFNTNEYNIKYWFSGVKTNTYGVTINLPFCHGELLDMNTIDVVSNTTVFAVYCYNIKYCCM